MAVLLVMAAAFLTLYRYVYREHRRVENLDADYTLSVARMEQEFLKDAAAANIAYGNKVVEVSGTITTVDAAAGVLTIDEKLFVQCDSPIADLTAGDKVRLKGRFVGFDDLLGEFRMDQAVLLE